MDRTWESLADRPVPLHRPSPWVAWLSSALLILALAPILSLADAEGPRYRVTADKPFEEVVFDLKIAISEHNFRLTGENRIGKAIAERERIPFPRATVLHFCNLEYARRLLEADPPSLLRMPCRITVYEQADGVVLSVRLLPQEAPRTQGVNREINRILRAIVDESLE